MTPALLTRPQVDWKGRPYVYEGDCSRHGRAWFVRTAGNLASAICEFCALGLDQTNRRWDRRRM